MMRSLRISDAARCILMNVSKGPNLVCPKESICGDGAAGSPSLWTDALVHPRNRVSLVSWQGSRLSGIGSTRNRNGRRVWEVDHLYVPSETNGGGHSQRKPWDSAFLDLLEALVREVGTRLGERIVVRLPSSSPVVFQARRSGFFPCYEESLMEGAVKSKPNVEPTAPLGLSDRLPGDDYGLFQLFCAAVPHEVREKLGLTFDQWQDAREPSTRDQREWVLRHNDRITGWLCVGHFQGVRDFQVMAHPDFPALLPQLLDWALSHGGVQHWLVPDCQEPVRDYLLRNGLRESSRYTLLVKTIAAPVRKHVMAAVEA